MYDVIIVGAGPGGATAAALMAQDGLRVLMLDKDTFPRDKVCGDAISGKSVDVLRQLDLVGRVERAESIDSWGIIFSGPYGDAVEIPFTRDFDRPIPPGFLCARTVFDQVLLERALEAGAELRTHTEVKALLWDEGRVVGVRARRRPAPKAACPDVPSEDLHAPLVIGADGAYSVVARQLGLDQLDEKHYYAAVRAYYEGVTGFHDRNYIELHFVEEALPGYFWVFPMAGGRANIGLGTLSAEIKRRGLRLKPLLDELTRHPRFRARFAEARRVGPVQGWGLPLGSKPRPMAGDGWLLVGDAASLIDPFTGEGIGNAMVSGAQAAAWAAKAKAAGCYSAAFFQGYEQDVHGLLRGELRLSHMLQRLMQWKWPLNLVIRKAARSAELADTISCMFDDLSQRRRLVSPLFYLRVLTA